MDPQFASQQSFHQTIKTRYIVAAVFVIICAMIIGWYLGTRQSSPLKDRQITNTLSPIPTAIPTPIGLRLEKDKIYFNDDELFINVKNVTEVRFGPDGKTIHFKRNRTGESPSGEQCANLKDGFELAPPNYPSPPPTQAPWDYQRINHAYTIRGCSGGGYIDDTHFFAYLQMQGSESASLIIEDSSLNITHTIPVDTQYISGFFDGSEAKVASYWGETIEGIDQKHYVYPLIHSSLVNDRMVLAFARLLLVADVGTNRLIGAVPLVEPGYNVVATSFWFETEKNIPLVVVDSGWEGVENYQALLDFSGDTLKVVNLKDLGKSGFNLFKIRKVSWESNAVRITTYTEQSVNSEIKDITDGIKNWEDQTETRAAEAKAVDRLKNEKGYQNVKCMLSPGVVSGCFAATDISTYRYIIGGDLQKL